MKKAIAPIAMKCSKKEFELIKPKLKKLGEIGRLIDAFGAYKYLTNNYNEEELCFDFINNKEDWAHDHKGNIHESWNEKLFLSACGIETEPEYVITPNQLKILSNVKETEEVKYLIKEWFPEALKVDKVELEAGKWYKNPNIGSLAFCKEILDRESFYGYGFGSDNSGNEWFDISDVEFTCSNWKEATPEEITEALTKEAVKRYKVGDYVKCLQNTFLTEPDIICDDKENKSFLSNNSFWIMANKGNQAVCVFNQGKWATVTETISREEAEKQLGKKII